jgi:hypothetical protein
VLFVAVELLEAAELVLFVALALLVVDLVLVETVEDVALDVAALNVVLDEVDVLDEVAEDVLLVVLVPPNLA